MRVAVVVEQRFDRTPDGRIWTEAAFGYPFWRPYLGVFSEVLVVARVRDVPRERATWTQANGDSVGFLEVPYYVGPGRYLLKLWGVHQTARRSTLSRDAVILRIPSQIATCFAPVLRRMGHPYGIQAVGDPQDVFAPGAVRHGLRPFFRWWFPYQMRRQCRSASACTYVTERTLQTRYPPAPGVFVNYYSDVFLPEEAFLPASRRYCPSAPPRNIVTVGSLHQPYKGVDVLIDAVALCAGWGVDLDLTVIGDGRYRSDLESRAGRLGLAARVQFAGALSDPQAIRAHLDKADLFVLSSRTEGLPRAMLEATARGLPCIGSRVGGIPELLPSSDMVPAGDATALALKIREVLHDPARLTAMSERNLATAHRHRSEVLNQKRLAFLNHVLQATERWVEGRSGGKQQ